jgi:uncharacterized delta-60 repeat protein
LFSVAVLLAGGAATVRGQSALDGFDPNANGLVSVVLAQPDGKILIGGNFTTVLGVPRNYIARLNSDGTLDTTFNPNADDQIVRLALQADGKILAGGLFSSIGGQTRSRIARLDPVTGLADSWNPDATTTTSHNGVSAILVQADGKVLVGGDFTGIGGQTRNHIARLDAVTGAADTWNPNASDTALSIAIQADGKILVAGGFLAIGGQSRPFIARLDPVTGLADSWNPNSNDVVFSIAVQADGKILAVGQFASIGGQTRTGIARLDAVTGLADTWNPNANPGVVLSVAIQTDGKIIAGGSFTNIGGQPRNRIARLDAVTGLADSFDPNPNSFVSSIAVQQDGKVLVGGPFTSFAPNGGATVTRNNIARLETNGGLDQTLNLSLNGTIVLATAVQSDGKILIGGDFTSVLGVTRNKIARLNADGTLDVTFNPNANGQVFGMAVQPDGKIIAAGQFTAIGGQNRSSIARLDPVTGAADSWDPFVNGFAYEIALQSDGKVVVGGSFTAIGGQNRSSIARLDPVTGLADSFNPAPPGGGNVSSIAIQPDGKILAGGPFSMMGGQPRNGIARLDPVTGLADSWNPNADGIIFTIALQPDGKILASGNFGNIGGQARNRIARLDAVTGLADSWNPFCVGDVFSFAVQADGKVLAGGSFSGTNSIGGQTRNRIARLDGVTGLADSFDPNANNVVHAVAALPDGKVLAGGAFTTIGGQPRNTFARLSNDTAALQNLAVTPTTVTWTRNGAGSQFAHATFEQSTDNGATYTFLGNGTASGNNWALTGLSFPTSQNILVRGRGYYRTGYDNGSESITESVWNAIFVSPTLQLTAAVSRKTHGTAGDFDLPLVLDPAANSTVEPRLGGPTTIVFTFSDNITAADGMISSNEFTITNATFGSASISGDELTLNLSNVIDQSVVSVTLNGIDDTNHNPLTGDNDVAIRALVGDANQDQIVDGNDFTAVKAHAGQPLDQMSGNFLFDLNINGVIARPDGHVVRVNKDHSVP